MKAPRGKKKDWNVIIYKKKNGCIIGTVSGNSVSDTNSNISV